MEQHMFQIRVFEHKEAQRIEIHGSEKRSCLQMFEYDKRIASNLLQKEDSEKDERFDARFIILQMKFKKINDDKQHS